MIERLYAVRGATSVEDNDAEAILAATEELMRALIDRNELTIEQFVSCIFTATSDLNAEFPALAARRIGFDRVPLICTSASGLALRLKVQAGARSFPALEPITTSRSPSAR